MARRDRGSATHGRQVFVKCGMANTSLVNVRLTFEPIDVTHQDSTSSTERGARGLSPCLTNGDHYEKNCTHHLRCAADLRIGGPNGSGGFPATPPQQGPPQQFSRSLQSGERADQRPSNPTSLPT